MDFLLKIYPMVTSELEANARSHAFDGKSTKRTTAAATTTAMVFVWIKWIKVKNSSKY